jgi:hypothetical protein
VESSPPPANRAAEITALLACAPDNTDHEAVGQYVRRLAKAGLAVLFINPGSKVPTDFRHRRGKFDRDGVPTLFITAPKGGGVYQASTDVKVLDRHLRMYIRRFGPGCAVNLAVVPGRSGLVAVDADTPAQVGALVEFLSGAGLPGAAATVRTPGHVGGGDPDDPASWAHNGGGHWWFVVPEGVELAGGSRVQSMTAEGGFALIWGAGCYVLIPPSTRPEGCYDHPGDVAVLPDKMLTLIAEHTAKRARKREERAQRAASGTGGGCVIAEWGARTSWFDILDGLPGWTNTGITNGCGCDVWTAPGTHASPRSAIAHEPGCGEWTDSPDPPLYIFTDTPGEPFEAFIAEHDRTVTRLHAVTLIDYEGDLRAAMEALNLTGDLSVDDDTVEFLNGYGGTGTNDAAENNEDARERLRELFGGAPITPGSGVDTLPNYPVEGLAGPYAAMATEIAHVIHEKADAPRNPDADLVMAAVTLDAMVATVLQPWCLIRDRHRNFCEPLVSQSVISTDIGGGKTPAMDHAIKPLKVIAGKVRAAASKRRSEQASQHKLATERANEARKEATKARKTYDEWINAHPELSADPYIDADDPVAEAARIIDAKKADELADLKHKAERLEGSAVRLRAEADQIVVVAPADMFTADVTSQHLRNMLAANGGCAALITDEASTTFANLMGHSAGQNGTAEWTILVTGYNGGLLTGGRVSTGDFYVESARVTACLMIQPDRLAEPLADRAAIDQGVWARMTVVHQRSHAMHYPHPPMRPTVVDAYTDALIALHTVLFERAEGSHGVLPVMELDDDAQAVFDARVVAMNARINLGGDLRFGPIRRWMTKHAGRVLRIAGRRHLMKFGANGVDKPVDAETMTAAWAVGDFYLAHACWTFDQVNLTGAVDVLMIHRVLDYIGRKREHDCAPVRESLLRRSGPLQGEPSPRDGDEDTLDVMERLRLVRRVRSPNRVVDVYLHPDLGGLGGLDT